MSKDSIDEDELYKKHIYQQIISEIDKNKLSLINENIINNLELENREKRIIVIARKIINKNNVGFFYLDEIIKKISNKYKIKDIPLIDFIVSLYHKGIIIPHKRESSDLFSLPPSLVDTASISSKNSLLKNTSEGSESDIKERERLNKEIIGDLNINRIDSDINNYKEESTTTHILESSEANVKTSIVDSKPPENVKIPLMNVPTPPKNIENVINFESEPLLINKSITKKVSKSYKKNPENDEKTNPEDLIKIRNEILVKVQKLLNKFNFLDAMAEIEIVIDISSKLNDQKAVELYRKQSETIINTGLKYEDIIEKIKSNSEYKNKIASLLKTTIDQIKQFWKKNDFQKVYESLKKAATFAYYIEDTETAIQYNEQAEAIKSKIKN